MALLSIGLSCASAQTRRPKAGHDESSDKPPQCDSLPEEKRRQTEECKTAEERREDEYERRLKEIAEHEKPRHSSFFHWLHLDGLWVPMSMGASTYGLVGTHMTIPDIHGANLFGPPGVMLMLDESEGHRRIRPALTWGVSFHLTDFRTPGSGRNAQLYLNLTKAWTTGDYRNGIDMAGLSVTWKK
jgi:hypothetical protein